MENEQLKYIVEAALLGAGRPLDLNQLQGLFGEESPPDKDELRTAIASLQQDYANRGIALVEVASGFRIQVRSSMSGWLARLWEERAPRYSRALMETLAIIAYRQPVTRGHCVPSNQSRCRQLDRTRPRAVCISPRVPSY